MTDIEPLDSIFEDVTESTSEEATSVQLEPPSKRVRRSYDCEVCRTSYTEKRTLIRHFGTPAHCKNAGKPQPKYTCEFCHKSFTRDDIRQRHEKEVHFYMKRRSTLPDAIGATAQTSSRVILLGSGLGGSQQERDSQLTVQVASGGSSSVAETSNNTNMLRRSTTHDPPINASDGVSIVDGTSWHSSQEDAVTDPHVSINDSGVDMTWTADPDGALQIADDTPRCKEVIDDRVSVRSISTLGSIKKRLELPRLLRSTLIARGAAPRKRGIKAPPLCALCQNAFGNSKEEVRMHLDRHMREYVGGHICEFCQVGFSHWQDLEMHHHRASKGDCGFEFDHIQPCTGHHWPNQDTQGLTDNDRMRFCQRLGHWEQSQLQLYLSEVNGLLTSGWTRHEPDCWSLGALLTPLESVTSLLSNLKLSSAPEPIGYQGDLDYEQLRFSARNKVVRATKGSMRNTAKLLRVGEATYFEKLFELMDAIKANDFELTRRLVLSGADVNGTIEMHHQEGEEYRLFGRQRIHPGSPMTAAALNGNRDIIELLIAGGAALNAGDIDLDFGWSPLCIAAKHGNSEAAAALLAHGAANIRGLNSRIDAPLFFSVAKGHSIIVSLLLDYGANANWKIEKYGTILGMAVYKTDTNIVRLLLGRGADANISGDEIGSPLECAIRHNQVEIVNMLLDHGANVNTIQADYGNVLALASHYGQVGAVKLLLAYGANVNYRHSHHYGPLGCAASEGQKEMIQVLLENGAEDFDKGSALEIAALRENEEIVDILLTHRNEFPLDLYIGDHFFSSDQACNVVTRRLISRNLVIDCNVARSSIALELLKKGLRPNSRTQLSDLLKEAIRQEDTELVHMLLQSSHHLQQENVAVHEALCHTMECLQLNPELGLAVLEYLVGRLTKSFALRELLAALKFAQRLSSTPHYSEVFYHLDNAIESLSQSPSSDGPRNEDGEVAEALSLTGIVVRAEVREEVRLLPSGKMVLY